MKHKLLMVILTITTISVLCGCAHTSISVTNPPSDNISTNTEDEERESQWKSDWVYDFGDPCIGDLKAGQHIKVGTVTIANDLTKLYVTFETTNGWFMTLTHMHIAKNVEDIPQTDTGNPIPGLFDYHAVHDPPVQKYTYEIEICSVGNEGWNSGDEFFVAAHAEVQKVIIIDGEEKIWEETAWGCEEPFPGANWATFCVCNIQCTKHNCLVKLPASQVTAQFFDWDDKCRCCWWRKPPGPTGGFWKSVLLSDVPIGYSVWNKEWTGWCLEINKVINCQKCDPVPPQPDIYSVTLYSSQSSNLPRSAALCDWERINYILNHKHPAASECDIQQAMWFFTVPKLEPDTEIAWAMVHDAIKNGAGYHPGANWDDVEAVILDAGEPYQMTFIEVNCTMVSESCGTFCPPAQTLR